MTPVEARFCIRCGTALKVQLYQDGHPHPVCPSCGWAYFPDPKVAAAALVVKDHTVLLVQRHFDPAKGMWTLPAGFLNAEEDPASAAERECLEETGLAVRVIDLFHVSTGRDHPRGADVVLVYLAEIVSGRLTAMDDAEDARFFPLDQLPPLAFRATHDAIQKISP